MAFGYYRTLTVDHTQVPSTQTNFSVLVSVTNSTLKTVANSGHVQNSNGYDIVFCSDSGGITRLKWEMEFYDPVNGIVVAWVKIASLSSSVDVVFYMFYGDASITTDQSDPVNVWDADYIAVWHLKNGTTLSVSDSTTANSLTNTGLTAAMGQIDGAATVGSSHYALNSNVVNSAGIATLSAWVKATTATGKIMGFSEGNNSSTHDKDVTLTTTGKLEGYIYVGFEANAIGATTVTTGVWHYLTVVFNPPTNIIVYLDGVSDGSGGAIGVPFTGYGNPNLLLGGINPPPGVDPNSGSGTYLDGSIDEARISKIARSADWITCEWKNQKSSSTFLALGTETSLLVRPQFFVFL